MNGDLFIGLCYNIPTGSSGESIMARDIFDTLTEDLLLFQNTYGACNILIVGDFNSRFGERPDYVENESLSNLQMLPDDYVEDTQYTRVSKNKVVNENGLQLLDFCKQTSMRIVNGRMGEDKHEGKFTCIETAGSSVVDCVLCRPALFECFIKFSVGELNILSDHCLVRFELRAVHHHEPDDPYLDSELEYEEIGYKYVWDENKLSAYHESLISEFFLKKVK